MLIRKLAVLTTIALLSACSGGSDSGKNGAGQPASGSGAASAERLPNPPFAGETPKGAFVPTVGEPGLYGGTLVHALPGNPKSFNPILAGETSTTEVTNGPLFSGCWGYNQSTQESEPGLCEKFERAPDGLEYSFTLREGLLWSDGAPLTTDDFEFSYKVLTDPKVPCSVKDLFKLGKDAAGNETFAVFEKVDARTFKFKLTAPNVVFEYAVASIYVVPKHKWEGAYAAGEFTKTMTVQTPPADLVTSGPFRLKSFSTEERVVLERNPHYWKVDKAGHRLPYLDRVIFLIVPDLNASLVKFRNGETSFYEVRPDDFDLLKRDESHSDYVIKELGPNFNTNYLMFNLDEGKDKEGKPYVDPKKLSWFQKRAFRQAVSHAIDRDSLVRIVMGGRGLPHYGYTSPANKKWYSDKVKTYPFSIDTAKALMTTAGFTYKPDGTLWDGDTRVGFKLVTNSENPTRIALLNVLKDDFTKLGLEVNLQPVPFNDLVTALNESRNFEAVVLGWASGVPPDPAQMKNVLLSSGKSHNWYPSQKTPATPWEQKIDELMLKNMGEFDSQKRTEIYHEVEAIFSEELPQIGLIVAQDFVAGRKNLGNFMPSSLRPKAHWNLDQLFLKTLPQK